MSDQISWTNIGSTDFSGTFEGKDDLAANLLTYCHIFRIEESKIVEVTEFFDTALAQRVLGSVVPGP